MLEALDRRTCCHIRGRIQHIAGSAFHSLGRMRPLPSRTQYNTSRQRRLSDDTRGISSRSPTEDFRHSMIGYCTGPFRPWQWISGFPLRPSRARISPIWFLIRQRRALVSSSLPTPNIWPPPPRRCLTSSVGRDTEQVTNQPPTRAACLRCLRHSPQRLVYTVRSAAQARCRHQELSAFRIIARRDP
jgi:hypothetical protein